MREARQFVPVINGVYSGMCNWVDIKSTLPEIKEGKPDYIDAFGYCQKDERVIIARSDGTRDVVRYGPYPGDNFVTERNTSGWDFTPVKRGVDEPARHTVCFYSTCYNEEYDQWSYWEEKNVTHWMYFPAAPLGGGGNQMLLRVKSQAMR